jgi:dGTPase
MSETNDWMDLDNTYNLRQKQWLATNAGTRHGSVNTAHEEPTVVRAALNDRESREIREAATLSRSATLARGAGNRLTPENSDPFRTCFERDRDRILHSDAFRRLAGKTQVFIFPSDHQRTRLTHALEVNQVALSISRALGLNPSLTEAIALGHDCGHGPGGHASEDALSPYLENGFDHAQWGAQQVLAELNLCFETLDGIANHSWSRPRPKTPEAEVVSLADRIAYLAHDLEDAERAQLVKPNELPSRVKKVLGTTRSSQLNTCITDVIETTAATQIVGLSTERSAALADLRQFNYDRIYSSEVSKNQSKLVIELLRSLVDYFIANPHLIKLRTGDNIVDAVRYVAGMTDRYAVGCALRLLDWPPDRLPRGIDVSVPTYRDISL